MKSTTNGTASAGARMGKVRRHVLRREDAGWLYRRCKRSLDRKLRTNETKDDRVICRPFLIREREGMSGFCQRLV